MVVEDVSTVFSQASCGCHSFLASSVLATGYLTICQLTAQALTKSDLCTNLNYL